MTKQERRLWYDFLRDLPVPVKRQHPILDYIVDFYIPNAKLVIELDGSQHYTETVAQDQARDEALAQLDITVARYSNLDINDRFRDVCTDIALRLGIE